MAEVRRLTSFRDRPHIGPMTNRFFWVDLEMTGLDEKVDHILELAIIVTDLDLNPLEEYQRIIFQPPEVLSLMSEHVRSLHQKSGLLNLIPSGSPLGEVEKDVLGIIDRHFSKEDRVVLAGNSVGNDKRFIDYHLHSIAKRLHYRIIDVSSFKEIFKNKYGIKIEKKNAHRAIDDIRESIMELKNYLSFIQVPQGSQ